MPPDPPKGLCFTLRQCALHTSMQYLCLMTMQFQKWPTKFDFDWPFRSSINFSLYCTLGSILLGALYFIGYTYSATIVYGMVHSNMLCDL